jgi:hypothetical protein
MFSKQQTTELKKLSIQSSPLIVLLWTTLEKYNKAFVNGSKNEPI